MKLNANLIDTWLKNVPKGLKYYLIYGPEYGKAQHVSDKLIAFYKAQSGQTENIFYNFKQLKDSPSKLVAEVQSLSLFGDRKIIIIEDCPPSPGKELINFLKAPCLNDTIIIFFAEELKPASSLRKTLEDLNSGIAIACYKDDTLQISKFINQYLSQNNIQYDPWVGMLLAENMPANQLLIINELEKLITYKADDGFITADDVIASIGDSSEIGFDDFCKAIVDRNSKIIQSNINKMIADDTNFVLIIRILLKFFLRIHEVKIKALNSSVERAVSSLIPPVYFKQKDNLIHAATKLKDSEVIKFLKILHKIELECKTGKCDSHLLTFNALTYWGEIV